MLLTTSLCMLSAALRGLSAGAKSADAQQRCRHRELLLLWFNLKYTQELNSPVERFLVQKQDLASVLGDEFACGGEKSASFAADG